MGQKDVNDYRDSQVKDRWDPDAVTVRAGTIEDHKAICEFTKSTFDWGDYVPEAYLGWVAEQPREGQVYVAAVSGKPVGVTRVRYLSPDEAWFEGIRVHPEFRRLGIGKKLTEASIQGAKSRGIKVCRSAIDSDNEKSSGLATKFGFRIIASNFEYVLDVPLNPSLDTSFSESSDAPRGIPRGNLIQKATLPTGLKEGVLVSQAKATNTQDIHSAAQLARQSLTLIGCDFVWRSITESNMSSLAKEGLLWLAFRDGTVIAGVTCGGFWLESQPAQSEPGSDSKGEPYRELNFQTGSPFGEPEGVEAILLALADKARLEAANQKTTIKLSVNIEKGSPVIVPRGLKKDALEYSQDIWELRLW